MEIKSTHGARSLSYMPRMDILRLLAATLVILGHVFVWAPDWEGKWDHTISSLPFLGRGFGVTLFLVMSGYLMAQIYQKHPHARYSEFIQNRLVRVAPLGILLILASIGLRDINPQAYQKILTLLTLQFNFDRAQYVAPLWTVAVEFQFYLLMPIFAVIIAKQGIGTFAKLIASLLVFRLFLMVQITLNVKNAFDISYYSLIGRIDQFAIGILLAHLPSMQMQRIKGVHHLIFSSLAVAGILWVENNLAINTARFDQIIVNTWLLTIQGLVGAYFMIAFVQASIKIPFEKQLAALGAASYSMYLLHEMIVRQYLMFVPGEVLGIRTGAVIIVLPIVYAVSMLTYHWFEKPFFIFRVKYSQVPRS